MTEDEASAQPGHNIFRVDIDIIPDTSALDAFHDAFGFRPPAEPLLAPIFTDDEGLSLDAYVPWTAPDGALIAPPAALGAMKIRALPERDRSHKQLKDLADLHAILWYVTEYAGIRSAVRAHISDDDIATFRSIVSDDLYDRTAGLLEIDSTVVRESIEQLFV